MTIDTTTKWLIGAFIVALILAYGCYIKRPGAVPAGYVAPTGAPTSTMPTTTPLAVEATANIVVPTSTIPAY